MRNIERCEVYPDSSVPAGVYKRDIEFLLRTVDLMTHVMRTGQTQALLDDIDAAHIDAMDPTVRVGEALSYLSEQEIPEA